MMYLLCILGPGHNKKLVLRLEQTQLFPNHETCKPPTWSELHTVIKLRINHRNLVKSSHKWPTSAAEFNDFLDDIDKPYSRET
eukprot:scaffold29912_cov67-Cyclotella_meneghiniana.AAC.1